jgi:low affinity Fe/Cu permease
MTDPTTHADGQGDVPATDARTASSAEVVKAIAEAAAEAKQRAALIRQAPELHKPKLVLSQHVRGNSPLDKIAEGVNKFCGSMWVFMGITVGIVCWLILGPLLLFDKVPWPLLLTILNLPQLSIMISLQVSANRSQAASDKRAIADHETLIALHEMAKQQLDILHGQNDVLAILQSFARKDMPGKQDVLQGTADKILALVSGPAAAG